MDVREIMTGYLNGKFHFMIMMQIPESVWMYPIKPHPKDVEMCKLINACDPFYTHKLEFELPDSEYGPTERQKQMLRKS